MIIKSRFWIVVSGALLLACNEDALAFYDSLPGRWLNRVPMQERGGRNLLAFVNNSPTMQYDKLGLSTKGPVADQVQINFQGALITISVSVMDIGVCLGHGLDVTYSFDSDSPDTTEKGVVEDARYFCGSDQTTPCCFTNKDKEDGRDVSRQWEVTCHHPTPMCPSGRQSGSTYLSVDGRTRINGPIEHVVTVSIAWSYTCGICCELSGIVQWRVLPPVVSSPATLSN